MIDDDVDGPARDGVEMTYLTTRNIGALEVAATSKRGRAAIGALGRWKASLVRTRRSSVWA